MNNYNELAHSYKKTHEKPDKKFSILPTMLKLVDPQATDTILDIGCGDGFFTREYGKKAAKAIGVDNEQASLPKNSHNIVYLQQDMREPLPRVNKISIPFVLNYAEDLSDLNKIIINCSMSLQKGGKIVAAIDFPTKGFKEKKIKWGFFKELKSNSDGASFVNNLYVQGQLVCSLHAKFYKPSTVEEELQRAGFEEIRWHKPIIDKKEELEEDFWTGYEENCDLRYFTGSKR